MAGKVGDDPPQVGLAELATGHDPIHSLNPIVLIEINSGNRTTARRRALVMANSAAGCRVFAAPYPPGFHPVAGPSLCRPGSPTAKRRRDGRKVVCRESRLLHRRSAGAGAARGTHDPSH